MRQMARATLLLFLLLAVFYSFRLSVALSFFATVVFLAFMVRSHREFKARASRLSGERAGEGIHTFGRSANSEIYDPAVVRAVYEQLSSVVSPKRLTIPIRWEDRLKEDLGLDGDDLHVDVVASLAVRSGRSLEEVESNPMFGKVITAGDLVVFFNSQPRVEA